MLLVALGIGAFLLLSTRETMSEAKGPLELGDAPAALANDGPDGGASDALTVPPSNSRVDSGPVFEPEPETGLPTRSNIEKSFTGTGSITCVIDVPPDVEFPGYWQLVFEPSKILQGRETAVYRTLEFERGQYEIERRAYRETVEITVDDLPLGGYSISVRAEDMNCAAREVVLYKVAGNPRAPGKTHVRVTMTIEPAGFLDGSVVEEDGTMAEDCPLTLESIPAGKQLITRSQPDGTFLFPTVLRGRYKLTVGNLANPLVEPREIVVEGRETSAGELRLPPTASVVFLAIGPRNERVGEVQIRGSGSSGDAIDVVSDGAGEAIARYLRAGRYRIRAQHMDGASGKMTIELDGSEDFKIVEIRVR